MHWVTSHILIGLVFGVFRCWAFCDSQCTHDVTVFVDSVLGRESHSIAESLVHLRVAHNLLFAMGNSDYADSQRQAAISLGVSLQ